MTDCNRAAVHVQSVGWNAELVTAVENLNRERLIQLPQVDVLKLETGQPEQLRDRKHWTDAHLIRLAAGNRKAAEDTERLQAFTLRNLCVHHDAGAGAVRELALIARRDHAAKQRRADL